MITNSLTNIRKKKKLTQQKLADKAGLTREGVAQIETGRRKPYLETAIKLADALEISLDELVGRKEA